MTVYGDREQIPWRGKLWGHLVADSLDEVHAFACGLGDQAQLVPGTYLLPPYDVTMNVCEHALKRGAVSVGNTDMLNSARRLKAELAAMRADDHALPAPLVRVVQQPASLTLF